MTDVKRSDGRRASTEFRHRILETRSGGLQTADAFGGAVWKAPFLEVARRIHAAIQRRALIRNRHELHSFPGVQRAHNRLKREIGAAKRGLEIVCGLSRISRRQWFGGLPDQRNNSTTVRSKSE